MYLKGTGKYKLCLYSRNLNSISDQIDLPLLRSIFDNVYLSTENTLTGQELKLMTGEPEFDVIDL